MARRQNFLDRRHLSAVPQLAGALVSIAAFTALYFFINRTDFGRALEATREEPARGAGRQSTRTRCSHSDGALAGHWLASPGAIIAMFFYVYPDVGASFALIGLCHGRARRLRQRIRRLCGGIVVRLVEAGTTLDPGRRR